VEVGCGVGLGGAFIGARVGVLAGELSLFDSKGLEAGEEFMQAEIARTIARNTVNRFARRLLNIRPP